MEREGPANERRRKCTGGAGEQGERVRVPPGAVPRARARPARAPRHLRAQVLQHPSAYGMHYHRLLHQSIKIFFIQIHLQVLPTLLHRHFVCFQNLNQVSVCKS